MPPAIAMKGWNRSGNLDGASARGVVLLGKVYSDSAALDGNFHGQNCSSNPHRTTSDEQLRAPIGIGS